MTSTVLGVVAISAAVATASLAGAEKKKVVLDIGLKKCLADLDAVVASVGDATLEEADAQTCATSRCILDAEFAGAAMSEGKRKIGKAFAKARDPTRPKLAAALKQAVEGVCKSTLSSLKAKVGAYESEQQGSARLRNDSAKRLRNGLRMIASRFVKQVGDYADLYAMTFVGAI